MKLDILAIGAHPDDVELGCAGTLLKHIAEGYKAGIVDLTLGELGTRGSVADRMREVKTASKIIGLSARENLKFKDGFFQNDKAHQQKLIQVIRKYKPDVVLTNAVSDRHPDHGRSAQLTRDACFLSGLTKIKTTLNGKKQEAHRPKAVYHYIQALHIPPTFVVDITNHFEKKLEAIHAFKSQFYNPDSTEPNTFISSPEFLDFVMARAIHFGLPAGVKYAEAFTVSKPVGVPNILKLF